MSYSNLLLDSNGSNSNDSLIQPNRKDSISMFDAVLFYLNVMLGVRIGQTGKSLR